MSVVLVTLVCFLWKWVWILEARSENGCGESNIFWSDTRSGFKEPGGTLNSQNPVVPRQEVGINGKRMEAKKGKCVPVHVNSQTKGLGRGYKQRALGTLIGTLIGHSLTLLNNTGYNWELNSIFYPNLSQSQIITWGCVTVEPRLSGLTWTWVNSPDNQKYEY